MAGNFSGCYLQMVVPMMAALSVFGANQEFDDFLYAPVDDKADQMPLSVLSALTRLNLDPWGEASELSKLPQDTAIQRLAGLIARLPAMQSGKIDSAVAATRLVALLPRPARSISLPSKAGGRIELPSLPSGLVVKLLAALLLAAAALLFAMAREQSSQSALPDYPYSNKSPAQTL